MTTRAQVWNPTVANLTLMALGSSAPEILLSVIEILSNGFFTGDLGPSTIVGSASFNLLVITAICVVALPNGESRKIEDMAVFKTTAFFSIFAYVWLLVILLGPWSPNVVELWEALLTFLFFPILVVLAYAADRDWLVRAKVAPAQHLVQVGRLHFHPYEFSEMLRRINSDKLTKEEQAELVAKLALQTKNKPSRAVLRMNAIRQMTAQKRKTPKPIGADKRALLKKAQSSKDWRPRVYFSDVNGDINTKFAFLESDKNATLGVMRHPAHGTMEVAWATRDGTAKGGDDFEKAAGVLRFAENEVFQEIALKLFDDDATEDDEIFYVDLQELRYHYEDKHKVKTELGPGASAEIVIIDDDEPGEIGFAPGPPQQGAPESDEAGALIATFSEACGCARVKVQRCNGSTGEISCDYETIDGTAVAGADYEAKRGSLVFKSRELEKTLLVPVVNHRNAQSRIDFVVRLSNLRGPGRAGFTVDRQQITVYVEADKATQALLDDVDKYVKEHQDAYAHVVSDSWAKQFRDALSVCHDDDDEPPGTFQYVMHALTLPWKLLFALVPPTCYCGGWACFVVALFMIGLVTAFIGDLAALFGCQIGLPDSITAITFVALGTSLPDAFASKTAAIQDDTADASVGNVTGSNSVNVFLGLGLPWSIAAIYWSGGFYSDKAKKKWHNRYGGRDNDGSGGSKGPRGARTIGESTPVAFVVPAGDLAVTVLAFVVCGLICMAILAYRRKTYGAELGGPRRMARVHSTIMVCLWLAYILISSMSTLGVF